MAKKILPRAPRIPIKMRALLIHSGGTLKTTIHELSRGGCLAETLSPLAAGDDITVASTFETTDQKMFKGKVLYTSPDDGRIVPDQAGARFIGIRFDGLSPTDQIFLDQVVKDNRFKQFRRLPSRSPRPA